MKKKNSATTSAPLKIRSTLGLAKHLGLSEWTVSRAINGHPEVKAATRERIMKAMDDLGFRPNPVARKLSGKAMGIVGVSVVNAHNRAMVEKFRALDNFLRQYSIRAILSLSAMEKETELRTIKDFLHLQVDGIVSFQSVLDIATLNKMLGGIPCVHVDPNENFTPRVRLDRDEAMRQVTEHLLALGHRSFGLLGIPLRDVWRRPGVVKAVEKAGLNPEKCIQYFGMEEGMSDSYADGVLLAKRALAAKKRATAYIALNDEIAIGSIDVFSDAGYRVPEDFSIVGFDNLPVGMYLRPSLTTVDQQIERLIASAGELLLEALGIKTLNKEDQCISVIPQLIVRESTGPVARRAR